MDGDYVELCKKKDPIYIPTAKALEVDFVAKRYGKLPSEVVGLNYDEYTLNLVVGLTGLRKENEDARRRNDATDGSRTKAIPGR